MNNARIKVGQTRRRKSQRLPAPDDGQYGFDELLSAAANSGEAYDRLRGLLGCRQIDFGAHWRGRDAIPPGSLLEMVCDAFARGSNIPLEIPLLLTLHLISGHALRRGVTIKTPAGVIHPKLWSLILANSSAGKTFSLHQILQGLTIPNPEVPGMAGAVSAAAIFQTVKNCPNGLMIRDEFGQFVGRIESDLRLADFKDFLLRLFDGQKIEWTTKKDGLEEVANPQISILGLTQHATWHKKVSAESMLDGFSARFSLLIAKPDPARKWQEHPIWKIDTAGWSEAWMRCEASMHAEYTVTSETEEQFCSAFRRLAGKAELPEAFFRRILHSCHRLACIYHILCANPDTELTTADYGWALRLIRHHIDDAVEILGEQNLSEVERLCLAAEDLRKKCEQRGEVFSERTLYRNFRGLTPQSAHVILRLTKPASENEY